MRQFPDEDLRTAELAQELAQQFDFAARLYGIWFGRNKDKWYSRSKLPIWTLQLSKLLDVQACRQFRCIVEDCRRGEAFCAHILARSLFETVLALLFVLKPTVRIVVEPDNDPKTGIQRRHKDGSLKFKAHRPKKKQRGHIVSRELRADLYIARSILSAPKFVIVHTPASTPKVSPISPIEKRSVFQARV